MTDTGARAELLDDQLPEKLEEHTCRICQCEGTDEDPLFFPCKCRGSIKYIHQGCLEEWLKRSGRDASCDICHQKYKFTTVYFENAPERAPIHLILLSIRSHIINSVSNILTIFGIVGGVIQIPLFYALIKRFLTWCIDGKTLHEDFFQNLVHGDKKFEGDPYSKENLGSAFFYTYLTSLGALILTIFIIGCLFILHEWVSKDSGFSKLIHRAVGFDRKVAVDVVRLRAANPHIAEADRGLEEDFAYMENLNRLLQEQDLLVPDEDRRLLANAIENLMNRDQRLRRQFENRRNELQHQLQEDEDDDPNFEPDDELSSDGDSESDTGERDDIDDQEEEEEAAEFERFMRFNENERLERREAEENVLRLNQERERAIHQRPLHNLNEVPDIPNIPIDNRVHPIPQQVQEQAQPVRQNQNGVLHVNVPAIGNINAAPGPAAAAANQLPNQQNVNNIDPEDFLTAFPVHVMVAVADILICAYLTFAYFIPSLVGHFIFQVGHLALGVLSSLLERFVTSLKLHQFINPLLNQLTQFGKSNPEANAFLTKMIIDPMVESFTKIYNQNVPLSTFERFVPLALSYGLLFFVIMSFLRFKESKHNYSSPLLGFQRKVFVLLYGLVSTLKVFLIFTIELAFFPAACGMMLEFVLAPFVHPTSKLIFSHMVFLKEFSVLKFILYWACGTIYMCLFALYIGMVRRYILRPGALFFIRSQDDPNARLVHDTLVCPLRMQLSKIGLSALVYTLFILIGFGVVSYGLRLTESPLIPIYFSQASSLSSFWAARKAMKELPLIKKYVRQYWTRAFKISSAKTRLSSFILGHHKPRERGYVKYRSLTAMIRGAKPDYSDPRLLSDVKEIFRTTDTQAVFIPDGNLVRAPKNDVVSRKFVRSLFIPVTKDDIPLRSEAEMIKTTKLNYDDFDDSEDEITTTNQYEIVYRPPHFGARAIGLVCMLWVFAVILIAGTFIFSHFVGKPLQALFNTLFGGLAGYLNVAQLYDDGVSNSYFRLDATSISIGLEIIISALKTYDTFLTRRFIEVNVDDELPEPKQNWGRTIIDFFADNIKKVGNHALIVCSILYGFFWCVLIHDAAIEAPYRYFFGIESDAIFTNDFVSFSLHLVASFFTVAKLYGVIYSNIMKMFRGDDLTVVTKNMFSFASERFLKTQFIAMIAKVIVSSFEYFAHPQLYTSYKAALYFVIVEEGVHKNITVYILPLVVLLVFCYHVSLKAYTLLRNVNAEVKEKYYSRGKTLENTELEDERLGVFVE